MTKKKAPSEKKKRGRPAGSGEGLTELLATSVTPEVAAAVVSEAEARGVERSVVLREIITRWAKRQRP